MNIAVETTGQVVDRRRLMLLNRLLETLAETDRIDGIRRRVAPILFEDRVDLPQITFRGVDDAHGGDPSPPAVAVGDVGPATPALELPLGFADEAGQPATMVVQPNEMLDEDDSYLPFLRLVASTVGSWSQTPTRCSGSARSCHGGSHEVLLEPDSAVVFYTDGLTERRGAHPDVGFQWLCDVLQGQNARPPEAIADHVIRQLGGVHEDDVAIVVLAL